jgi:hypothetical protein
MMIQGDNTDREDLMNFTVGLQNSGRAFGIFFWRIKLNLFPELVSWN